jgi:protein MAK11
VVGIKKKIAAGKCRNATMSTPLKKRKVAFTDTEKPSKPVKVVSKVNQTPKKVKGKAKVLAPSPEPEIVEPTPSTSKSATTPSTSSPKFKVIAGSYEKLLYGLEGTLSEPLSDSTLKPTFIFPAHLSYIKAVATSPQGGKWLATGAGDEIIKVWDLKRKKEVGGLVQHEGKLDASGFFVACSYATQHRLNNPPLLPHPFAYVLCL